ncbi:MAG: TIGR04372 family glycosyltransferase [Rhodospirillaceae bacterium]
MIRRLIVFCLRVLARFVVVPLFWLAEHVTRIRITPVYTARIGHLAINTYLYIADGRARDQANGTHRLLFGYNPCNRTLFEALRREVRIFENRLLTFFYMSSQDILEAVPTFLTLPHEIGEDRVTNAYQVMDRCEPRLRLSAEEERAGHELLERMGVGRDDWFVCFQARDPAYHVNRVRDDRAARHWAQGNSDIATYMEAAEYITSLGGYAIRMGSVVTAPLPQTSNPRIIDYATDFRSDLGDIYLLSHCRFSLAAPTGTSIIPTIFGVPVAMANQLPLVPNPIGRHGLYNPKLIYSKASGKPWTFAEHFAHIGSAERYYLTVRIWSKFDTYETDTHGVLDNTPGEIRELCQDMFDQLEGRPVDPLAAELQDAYREKFFKTHPDVYTYGPKMGPRFLLRHQDLLN